MRACCGNCGKHIPIQQDEFMCDNPESENYGLETEYGDSCEDWVEK